MPLVQRRLLFLPAFILAVAHAQTAPSDEPVETLSDFSVLAGRFPTGSLPSAALNWIEVVSTPGATADINRTLQTFPGVQLVDEGNALFVRGGDSSETITLVNGIRYPSATRLAVPSGNFSFSLDPFQTKSITFLNGGLGAEYGNVLSGVVDLTTSGTPSAFNGSVNLGLGALGASAAWALGHDAGLRFSAARSSLSKVLALNGAPRDFTEPPNGHDISVTATWSPSPDAGIKAYALEQQTQIRLRLDDPLVGQAYANRLRSRLGTVSWENNLGSWHAAANLGAGESFRIQTVDSFSTETISRDEQFAFKLTRELNSRAQLSFGAEVTHERDRLRKINSAGGSVFEKSLSELRSGLYAEIDQVLASHVRTVVGVRADHSQLSGARTIDPRLSFAWEPRKDLSFSVAGGAYHQVPDFYLFIGANGQQLNLSSMRADDVITAVQFKNDERLVRLELYSKQYENLVQLDRNYVPIAGGRGRSQGLDVFARAPLPGGWRGRLTYSLVDTRRTDPNTGLVARAPWDVTHSVSVVVERNILGWNTGLAWRYATGHPFTPIRGGEPTATGQIRPIFGDAFSERLPNLMRLDLLLVRSWALDQRRLLTAYVSVNNLLNRRNLYSYRYTSDFSERLPVPSLFNRVLYFGLMLQFR